MSTKSTGSDDRRIGFFMVHNSIVDSFDLTPYEGWLYVIIARHVNQKTGVAFPSLTTLAREGNMSRMHVTRCLKALQTKGLLEIKRHTVRGKRSHAVNHYRLLDPPVPDAEVVTASDQEKADLVTTSDQGSHSQLLEVVTASYPNNTNMNNTNEQDERVAVVPKNGTTPPPQPLVALVDAYWQGLPAPPARKAYGRHMKTAKALHDAGYAPEQVLAYMRAMYQDKFWHDKAMSLEHVADNMPTWLASQKPSAPDARHGPTVTESQWTVINAEREKAVAHG